MSWSEHDLEVVRGLRGDEPELVARFERRYVNALGLARRWGNRLRPEDKPADGKLAGYLALIDYEVPPGGGSGRVGKTIRALRPTVRGGRPLTPGQRRRWAELLEHNRHDCAGMRAVCLRAARELETGSVQPKLLQPASDILNDLMERGQGGRVDPADHRRPVGALDLVEVASSVWKRRIAAVSPAMRAAW